MSEYARNQAADAGGDFPDLVYSNWLDKFFPCRVIASNGGQVFIEAQYHERVIPMRVPASVVYRRPKPEIVKN